MPTVYSYLRFSRPEQMEGDSERRQLHKSRDWAARHKMKLDESLNLRDLGVSAFRGKNAREGALGLFLECIETGRVRSGDFLVLENLDRLSRNEVFEEALPLVQKILKAGVSIVTLDPERIYSRESVREIGPLLEMLLSLYLANEESRKKSERLSQAWKQKRTIASKEKLTARAPRWLRLPTVKDGGDREKFEVIPERAAVIRKIFRMAADGAGAIAIVKRLNFDEVPAFGDGKRQAKFWQTSYVKKILANRAVLGEYQPHRMKDGKRVPAGEPVVGYFPAVVKESDFYAAHRSRQQRQGRGGRNGVHGTNLFTGLLKDARDGSNLAIVNKGDGPSLVSRAAREGKKGAIYLSFPYVPFEQSLLVWGHDLKLGDVLPRKATNLESEIVETEGELAALDTRLGKIKERLRTAGDIDAILDVAVTLDHDRNEAKEKLERLKADQSTPEADAVDGLKKLIQKIRRADGPELQSLRLRLRQYLIRIVDDIVVLTVQVNNSRLALVDVRLRSGKRRQVIVTPPGSQVELPEGIAQRDVREWRKWPAKLRQPRFDAMTANEREILRLDESGLNGTEIATQIGVSVSQVSRMLVRNGRRKTTRKSPIRPR